MLDHPHVVSSSKHRVKVSMGPPVHDHSTWLVGLGVGIAGRVRAEASGGARGPCRGA
jgi:hypothetical protein